MFISHAQNFEDVILWRALKHVEKGFYIDIGAQDPKIDSVSYAFYERGWRGVHVEPSAHYAEKLCLARPDEIVVKSAVGASSDQLRFFEIPDSGLSTGDAEIAARHGAAGFRVIETTTEAITLASLFERIGDRVIHWLKIDVEGMEQAVIESWLPSGARPWIVVVEATAPNSQALTYTAWEGTLRALGYEYVYFDGLNRYYISKEHEDLRSFFGPGPNVFDEFCVTIGSDFNRTVAAEYREMRIALGGARIAVEQLRAENAAAADALNEERKAAEQIRIAHAAATNALHEDRKSAELLRAAHAASVSKLAAAANALNEECKTAEQIRIAYAATINALDEERKAVELLRAEHAATANKLAATTIKLLEERMAAVQLRADQADAARMVATMQSSTSWKITAPIRGTKIAFRSIAHPRRSLRFIMKQMLPWLSRRPLLKNYLIRVVHLLPPLERRLITFANVRRHRREPVLTPPDVPWILDADPAVLADWELLLSLLNCNTIGSK